MKTPKRGPKSAQKGGILGVLGPQNGPFLGHFWAHFGPILGPLFWPICLSLERFWAKKGSKRDPKKWPKKGPFSGLPQIGPKSGVLGHYRFLALFGPFFWAHFWLRERDFGPKNRVHFGDQLLTKRAKNGPKHGTVKGGPL